MEAYRRYKGNLYRQAKLTSNDAANNQVVVLIVSALFGVVELREPIRNYDVTMTTEISPGMAVHAWWRTHNLRGIVLEAVEKARPEAVHCLLPVAYRRALRPWPPLEGLSGATLVVPEFPPGFASDHARGRYLRSLLDRE
jgi:cytoplasmic iron level regulating protein YaaA (DUF328/UPF0246 family)